MIVTFCSGSSYDHLFGSVEQKVAPDSQVLVYQCESASVGLILKAFRGEATSREASELAEYARKVDKDCVVFNWECCSGYTSETYPEGHVFEFLAFALENGFMTMFSDFSLKALINTWSPRLLGPNPFKKVGETSGNFELRFLPERLQSCPSAQLQTVGEMADGSKVKVSALGGTIVYGVDSAVAEKPNPFYSLEVLTVVTSHPVEPRMSVAIGEHKGAAGHVLLSYKGGGMLLTSMGHWVELMKIDTSEKKVFEAVEREYGAKEALRMQEEYAQVSSVDDQREWVRSNAVKFVQEQAPCTNMSRKQR